MNDRVSTKTRILDVAERLFGEKGFDGTSLRDITAEAGVNLAAVNYHFQTKDSLIDAVIERRIAPVNRRRLEMLEAAGPNPAIEQVVEAFLVPVLECSLSPMVALMGRVLATPDQFVYRVFKKHLAAIAQRFADAVGAALPELAPAERLWRLHFMGGTMAHVLSWSHVLPEMTGGLCDPSDRKALTARLVSFLSAGFRAPFTEAH
ncbi:MAG: TetR family transcriptional regulator [Acidobacteria bacterium]|jgi:AcrR family transcriptional regulator|nr:MAG: TetR family transcriptional regulator [Acidobacteriota bacterium]